MRPKSEIHTPKQDDEHPRPFHMSLPPPSPGHSASLFDWSVWDFLTGTFKHLNVSFLYPFLYSFWLKLPCILHCEYFFFLVWGCEESCWVLYTVVIHREGMKFINLLWLHWPFIILKLFKPQYRAISSSFLLSTLLFDETYRLRETRLWSPKKKCLNVYQKFSQLLP